MSWVEMDGWPKDIEVTDDFIPERKLIGPWADRWNQINYLEELEYPYYPGCRTYPVYIACEPFSAQRGTSSSAPDYETAVITVRYSSKNFGGQGIVVLEWLEPTIYHEPTTMNHRLYSQSDALRIAHPFETLEHSGLIFHHLRRKVGFVPATVLSAIDRINAESVYTAILDVTFAAETLKVLAPKIERTWKVGGLTNYSVHQSFAFKSNGGLGWNSIYNPATQSYQYMVSMVNNNAVRFNPYNTTAIVLV